RANFKRISSQNSNAVDGAARQIDEGRPVVEFPTVRDTVHGLGLGFVFSETSECKLTLMQEFYSNWNTTLGHSTK
ncbi:hypothetical protein HAX54_023478, partial [Datura stramonium]|nr:hypothetical protein [Datura stramonium]